MATGPLGSIDWFSVGVARVSVSLLTVVVNCRDPRRQAEFWARALTYRVSQRNRNEFRVSDPAGVGGSLYFKPIVADLPFFSAVVWSAVSPYRLTLGHGQRGVSHGDRTGALVHDAAYGRAAYRDRRRISGN